MGLIVNGDKFSHPMADMAVEEITPVVPGNFTKRRAFGFINRRRIERRNAMNGVAILAIEKPTVT